MGSGPTLAEPGTLPLGVRTTNRFARDTDRRAVWVGRHALENSTRVPNGQLRQVRNLPSNARVKAGLTPVVPIPIGDRKLGPSEPLNLLVGGQ